MFSQMRNMLKKDNLMTERDVIEQNEVLVKLPHIPNVRNHRDAKFPAQQADGNEFAHPGNSHRVHLDESGARGLQVILENDTVRNVFANRQLRRRQRLGQCLVPDHIIRVRRLFDPKWVDRFQKSADMEGLRQGPLLIRIQHHPGAVTRYFTNDFCAPNVARRVARAHLQFHRCEPRRNRPLAIVADLILVVIEPADGCIVSRIAAFQNPLP